jgi:hypothetical protein
VYYNQRERILFSIAAFIIATVGFIALFDLVQAQDAVAPAAIQVLDPPARSDGVICKQLPPIKGLKETHTAKAGYLYSTSRPISATAIITGALALYDADSTTIITLTKGSQVIASLVYSTGDKGWSAFSVVPPGVTGIQIKTPLKHPSTNLCAKDIEADPTPITGTMPITVTTPTTPTGATTVPNIPDIPPSIVDTPPTDLDEAAEPITNYMYLPAVNR